MDWINQVRGVLSRYGRGPGAERLRDGSRVARDFDDVARAAPRPTLSQALAWAMRSQEAPPFPGVMAHLYAGATGEQKAALLNLLLAMKPPAAYDELLQWVGDRKNADEDSAGKVPAETVRRLMEKAQAADPRIVERVCEYLAETPSLTKHLGVETLALAIGRVGERVQGPGKAMPARGPRG